MYTHVHILQALSLSLRLSDGSTNHPTDNRNNRISPSNSSLITSSSVTTTSRLLLSVWTDGRSFFRWSVGPSVGRSVRPLLGRSVTQFFGSRDANNTPCLQPLFIASYVFHLPRACALNSLEIRSEFAACHSFSNFFGPLIYRAAVFVRLFKVTVFQSYGFTRWSALCI